MLSELRCVAFREEIYRKPPRERIGIVAGMGFERRVLFLLFALALPLL